jgi:uncharacterized protein (TIGR02145 family)
MKKNLWFPSLIFIIFLLPFISDCKKIESIFSHSDNIDKYMGVWDFKYSWSRYDPFPGYSTGDSTTYIGTINPGPSNGYITIAYTQVNSLTKKVEKDGKILNTCEAQLHGYYDCSGYFDGDSVLHYNTNEVTPPNQVHVYTTTLIGRKLSNSSLEKPPTLKTTIISSITSTSASGGGTISDSGDSPVTSRGVCWSTSHSPTISDDKTSDGTGTGSFTSNLTGLTPGTNYHVRAYATNSFGTSYGLQIYFSTNPSIPTLTTATISSITSITASGGGNISSYGDSPITSSGVCWSTSQNPTISDNKTLDGTGTGSFTSSLTGLTPGTNYYVRAYASNSFGTAYGNQVSFLTDPALPTLTTSTIYSIISNTASGGGNISSNGVSPVTARGVCWGTSQNPTISDNKTSDGTGTGSFTSLITGLTLNTKYYVRAYATNDAGTAYGNEIFFITRGETGTVSDIDGNTYSTIAIGTQVWMAENLKTTKYANGIPIPYVNTSGAWAALNTPDKAYCYYNNNSSNNSTYGALYTWAAAMNGAASSTASPSGVQGACPTGWHLPSDAEWTILTDYLGGTSVAGGKLKETGTTHWQSPNTDATNESGFTALPGGGCFIGSFQYVGQEGIWWSSTSFVPPPTEYYQYTNAWIRGMWYNSIIADRSHLPEKNGNTIRCVKN